MTDYPFDQDRDNAGKTVAKRLKDRIGGDTSSFRTVIEKDIATGDVTMLRTKGGMPEITKTRPGKKEQEVGERTFVFKIFGAASAVIANKAGAGLDRIGAPFLTGPASYFVAAWKKVAKIKWMDVIRLDNPDSVGDGDVILNHAAFTEQDKTLSTYSPSGVPYVHRVSGLYAASNPSAATQSLLHIGLMSNAGRGVTTILKTGGEGPTVQISDHTIPRIGYSANVRAKPDGTFLFYGGNVSFNIYDNLLFVATTTWSRIKTQEAAPYVVEEDHGAMGTTLLGEPAVTMTFPEGYSGASGLVNYPGPLPIASTVLHPPLIPGSFVRKATLHSLQNYGQHTVTEIDDYAYVGSDIQMKFSSSVDIQNFSHRNAYDTGVQVYLTYDFINPQSPFNPMSLVSLDDNGGNAYIIIEYDAVIKYSLTTAIPASKKLTDVTWSRRASTRVWPIGAWCAGTDTDGSARASGCSMPANTHDRFDITELNVSTVDYLYADLDEDIYITLESSIYRFVQGAAPGDWQPAEQHDLYGYSARYVVSIRGVETEFPIVFTLPHNFGRPWAKQRGIGANGYQVGSVWYYPDIGVYHMGYKPTPIFNPAYMGQGNCPFIAYTTKAEEAQGVSPEFYLDMTVFLNRWGSNPQSADGDRYGSVVVYTPMQFIKAYYQFIQIETDGTIAQNPTAWEDHLFPTGRDTYRLQLCNGVKGPWAEKLGSDFSGNPQLDISRI